MTLTEFLLARIAEDADAALKRMHHAQENYLLLQDPKYLGRLIPGWYEWPEIEADAAVRLVECEAKRQIIAEHGTIRAAYPGTTIESDPCCETCSAGGEYPGRHPCLTMRLLALPYADHPDYNPEWRP